MCKAFFVRHDCDHASAPRVERCPTKIRFQACNGMKRIEVKSPTPCLACRQGSSPNVQVQPRRVPPPDSATHMLAKEIEGMATKKVKKTYDWMKDAEKRPLAVPKTGPVKGQSHQPRPKAENANAAQKAIPTTIDDGASTSKADGKRARQADARARNAAKKRDFRDALDEEEEEPSAKPATRKGKTAAAQSNTTAPLPTPSLIPTPPPSVKKPRKKAPPKSLTLADSSTASKPRTTTTTTHLHSSNRLPSPTSATTTSTPKTKTITSLAKLNIALEAKLRSFGYSPTLLHAGLLLPAEKAVLAASVHVGPKTQPSLRRSPRLTPEARAEVFLSELGRQIGASVAVDGTSRTLKSPCGGKGAVVSPDVDEVDEFERAMLASSSPSPRVTGSATGDGGLDGLFASSESEEE